ncbi:MAG: 2-amino-4-hydroxy-6-hydroxymethyldihydropteridine diphosphokinase [Pseudomonadaceae bacterium]|nr:2-amino-4-hydroxy-6-hydroxymethyldihydropteridine diphosphokinase [Pseudomonadaceae bacterium]
MTGDVSPPQVLIGLGSNLGESTRVIGEAFAFLDALAGQPVKRSSLWRTSPVDCPPGVNDYVNAAASFPANALPPLALLDALKACEFERGRDPDAGRNAPRLLDLDLLLYGSLRMATKRLILPHPRALGRRFVLVPAAEIAADQVWPGTDKTIAELSAEVESDEVISRLPG